MLMTINALLPVILVITIGYLVSQTGIISGDQWRGIERLAYYVLFPAILIEKIAAVDFAALPTLPMGATLLSSILLMTVLVLLFRPVLENVWSINGPRFTSIFQGSVRWNSFIALALADNLLGTQGLALIAIAIVAIIPVLNVISVLVLTRYAGGAAPSATKILQDLLRNPFILSTMTGLALNVTGVPLPGFVWSTLDILGSAALSVGIVCVGASLDLSSLRRPGPALTTGTLARLVLMPLVASGFATLYGLTGPALTATIIAASVPAASGAYLLAKQMGGDAKLMGEILTLQTLVAVITIPLALHFLT